MLAWVDEISWICASLRYPHGRLVTLGMDEVVFRHPVYEGEILRFDCEEVRTGTTSTTFNVEVYSNRVSGNGVIFSTRVTFVNVDEDGKKLSLATAG